MSCKVVSAESRGVRGSSLGGGGGGEDGYCSWLVSCRLIRLNSREGVMGQGKTSWVAAGESNVSRVSPEMRWWDY